VSVRRLLVICAIAAFGTFDADRAAAQSMPGMPSPSLTQHQHVERRPLFTAREASGTAWVPDETPMLGAMRSWRGWQVMFHGTGFVQFVYEPGDIHRTGGFSTHQINSVNWFMTAARRPLGRGTLGIRMMLSAEPWTVPGCGSLDLLATGEICEGDTIHDRQHPHDLFMELASEYDGPLRGQFRWQLYGGLSGEPALGPSGFPHRLSSVSNPLAPISHHWLDSTHITFGLVTFGVYDRRFKTEVSIFNSREPDEKRTDIDLGPLDSVSGRLTVLPTERLAIQVSAAHLRQTEPQFPPQLRTDLFRSTVSATYHRRLAADGFLAVMLAHGLNSGLEIIPGGSFRPTTQAVLVEGTLNVRAKHDLFGRIEFVQKAGHDLHAHEYADWIFPLLKVEAGYVKNWPARNGIVLGVGGAASFSVLPPELAPRYYGSVAPGVSLFLTLRPKAHDM
jgi:hypothetical protein